MDLTEFEDMLGQAEIQPLLETEDPRGEDYGHGFHPEGRPVQVYWKKLSGQEQFDQGKSTETDTYRFYYTQADNPSPVSVKMRVRFRERRDSEELELEVTNVTPYEAERLIIIDASRSY
jgi:hypothetical protein